MKKPQTTDVTASKPAIEPPFINEEGKYDVLASRKWQQSKLRPRWFHRSKFMNVHRDRNGNVTNIEWISQSYAKPVSDRRLKGKSLIKMAKRQRVELLKARG